MKPLPFFNPLRFVAFIALFILLFFLTSVVEAQDYRMVHPDQESFFGHPNVDGGSDLDLAIRIDSSALMGTDTLWYNYRVANRWEDGCEMSSLDTSWLGEFYIEKPNGEFLFFNRWQDTIRFLTQAPLNATWHMYEFGAGVHIEATVSGITIMTVLGQVDSVKIISLLAKDGGGTTVGHHLDGMGFAIGKTSGLVGTFRMFEFPEGSQFHDLAGKTGNATGLYNVGAEEIYDFDPGDILQIEMKENRLFPSPYSDHTYLSRTYLSKTWSANNDTVFYTYDLEFYREATDFNGFDTAYYTHDTVDVEYHWVRNLQPIPSNFVTWPLNHLPYEDDGSELLAFGIPDTDPALYNTSDYNGRMQKNWTEIYMYDGSSCFDELLIFGGPSHRIMIEGLGGGYFDWQDGTERWSRLPAYFKKGTETWGTQVDVSTLLAAGEPGGPGFDVEVFPNPLVDRGLIRIKGQAAQQVLLLRVMDLRGKEILVKESKGSPALSGAESEFQLIRSEFPSAGLYLWRIEGAGNTTGKLLVR